MMPNVQVAQRVLHGCVLAVIVAGVFGALFLDFKQIVRLWVIACMLAAVLRGRWAGALGIDDSNIGRYGPPIAALVTVFVVSEFSLCALNRTGEATWFKVQMAFVLTLGVVMAGTLVYVARRCPAAFASRFRIPLVDSLVMVLGIGVAAVCWAAGLLMDEEETGGRVVGCAVGLLVVVFWFACNWIYFEVDKAQSLNENGFGSRRLRVFWWMALSLATISTAVGVVRLGAGSFYLHRGNVALREGEGEVAERAFGSALESLWFLSPPYLLESAFQRYAEALHARDAGDLLVELANRFESLADPSRAHLAVGDMWLNVGRPVKAMRSYERVLTLQRDSVRARIGLGYAYLDMGDETAIANQLLQFPDLQLTASNRRDSLVIADALFKAKSWRRANSYYGPIGEAGGTDGSWAHFQMGKSHWSLGDYGRARVSFGAATAGAASRIGAEIEFWRGKLHLANGDEAAASRAFGEALRIGPTHQRSLFELRRLVGREEEGRGLDVRIRSLRPVDAVLDLKFVPGIDLLGADIARQHLATGDTLSVVLYFVASEPIDQRYRLALRLSCPGQDPSVEYVVISTSHDFALPTERWRVGEVVKERVHIRIGEVPQVVVESGVVLSQSLADGRLTPTNCDCVLLAIPVGLTKEHGWRTVPNVVAELGVIRIVGSAH